MAEQVKCPKCGRKQPHLGSDAIYWCPNCRMQFDDDPDEGGDYSNNPTRRAERQEGLAERRKQRKRGRDGFHRRGR